MKLKCIALNLNPANFTKQFVKSTHIVFREMNYKVYDINGDTSTDGSTITMKLAEKNSDVFDKELQVTCVSGHEVGQTYIIFDVLQPWGYMGLVNPSFSVAAWLWNNFQCSQFVDVDSGQEINILGRIGGAKMNVHNTSDTPMRHDLGVFSI